MYSLVVASVIAGHDNVDLNQYIINVVRCRLTIRLINSFSELENYLYTSNRTKYNHINTHMTFNIKLCNSLYYILRLRC